MTRTEWLSRLEAIYDEVTASTVSGSFLQTAQAYQFGDSGQNQAIDILLERTITHRKIEPFFEYEQLKPLITLKQFGTTSGTAFYSFSAMSITDYKKSYSVFYNSDNSSYYPATELTSEKYLFMLANEFGASQIKKPSFYIEANTIYLQPTPTASVANGLNFRYYKQPTAFSSSTDFTLPASTHEAILYYALFLAFDKDKNSEMSTKYLKLFYESLPQ